MVTVRDMQRRYPLLPLGYAVTRSWPGKPIGTIRDEAIVGTLALHADRAQKTHEPMTDILVTNMDSDALAATKHYLVRSQVKYDQNTGLGFMTAPSTRHMPLDPAFQAANVLIKWFDLQAMGASCPANFSVNALAYMASNGLAGQTFGETSHLFRDIADVMRRDFTPSFTEGQVVYNSAHALVRRMNQQKSLHHEAKTSSPRLTTYTDEVLAADVDENYFNDQFSEIVTQTSRAVFNAHAEKLAEQGMGSELYGIANDHTNRTLRVAATRIGHAYNSRAIVANRIAYYPLRQRVMATT
jgi:hypothetical protein